MKTTAAIWLDSYNADPQPESADHIAWSRIIPFLLLHLGLIGAFFIDVAPVDLAVAAGLYAVRMFAITGFYHRYFAHKTFATSRVTQFVWGVIGASATQRGPLWWAANHRTHHKHADTPEDPHEAGRGFIWSHLGWFLTNRHFGTKQKAVPDLMRFPELVWLDRFDLSYRRMSAPFC